MHNSQKTLVITLIFLMLSAMIVPLIKAETLTTDKLTYYIGQDNQAILTGTDFAVGSSVTLQVTIAEDATYLFNSDPIVVGADGTFTYTYPLPGTVGTYTAAALDEAGNVLATTIFLDPAAITLDQGVGPVGTTVSVTGSGFAASSGITIEFDGISVTTNPTTVTTTSNPGGGSFTCQFNIPSAGSGAHAVTALDSKSPNPNTATATFVVVKTQPSGLDLDALGTASRSNAGDLVVTLTSLKANDLIIVMFASDNSLYTVSSVTDTEGLTYTHRSSSLPVIYSTGNAQLVDEYWAVTTSAITSDTITISSSGSGANPNLVAIAFAISGANTNSPFDVNSGLPYTNIGGSSSASLPSIASVSTSYANDMIIGLEGHQGADIETAGSGYTLITSVHDEVGSVEFKTVSATLSGATVSFGTSVGKWAMIVDAVKAPPQITLNPTSGHVGDTVSISGSGFSANSAISATYDDAALTLGGTTTTDANGAFTGATFTVPESTAGGHTVEVTDANSNFADATFTVTPKITLNPTSGPVGTTVTVTGTGFAGTSDITIEYDTVAQATTPATVTTSSVGSFSSATFDVPASVHGSHTVSATDEAANTASATFSVTSAITLNPTSGPVGTTVTVTGTGFAGTSTVTIKFDGVTQTTVPPTVTTTAAGSFTCTFDVPSASLGPHTVSATDAATNTASATFTVTGSGFCAITSRGWVDLDTFKLIFTPDVPANPSYYRVTATNPGQFSYNVLKPDSVPGDVFTITIPYPFVTQGANPVLIYDGTPINNVPTGNVINGQFGISGSPVTLSSYGNTGTFLDTVTITIKNNGYTGSVYITIHLDYGLKKVAGGYSIGAFNSATETVGTFGNIDEASYEFTVAGAVGCDDSVSNVNVFKHDPGIGGLILNSNGDPIVGATVRIYQGSNTKGTPFATVQTDEDGWYMANFKYTGKPITFTVLYNGQTQSVTLKANGFLVVNFGV